MVEFTYAILFAMTLLSAVLVVFSTHTVYSALYLIVTMISISGIFILINAQLAAVLQILVYAGAIMMLFLFVIMLLNLKNEDEPPASTRNIRRIAALMFAVFLAQASIVAYRFAGDVKFDPSQAETVTSREVALVLLTKYLYAFEITSVMLLIAVIGAMTLARRHVFPGSASVRREG
jgi:NADH-quinone oxidoreductase subunit J